MFFPHLWMYTMDLCVLTLHSAEFGLVCDFVRPVCLFDSQSFPNFNLNRTVKPSQYLRMGEFNFDRCC